jgi:trypsin-like peptidase
MKRGPTCTLVVSLLVLGVFASTSFAGGKSATSPVRYSKIDASTLRVFAVGTVGVAPLEGSDPPVQVATPQAGHGTGFAVESDLVITAQHVVKGARHVVIRLPGKGGYLPARVVYENEDDDIAVLHVDARLPQIKMRESEYVLRVRQTVFAVGYPLDASRTQAQSARGIIAGHLEDASVQLDISLNPGNSGGPLVDDRDMIVGMVIARGDVKKGVQGIGWAVPIRKLRTAVGRAHRALGSGRVAPLSEHDQLSARVVDELVGSGTLSFGSELGSLDKRSVERQVDILVERLEDADLLVFLAGNLWNAALAIETRKVRAIAGKPLSRADADVWVRDLKHAAARLAQRSVELDHSIRDRSKFVELALAEDHAGSDEEDAPVDATDDPWEARQHVSASLSGDLVVDGAFASTTRAPRTLRWTVQTSPSLRLATDRAFGGELAVQRKLISGSSARVRPFAAFGASAGLAVDGNTSAMLAGQSFAALELGGGLSVRLGRTSQLELYGGVAPSYTTVVPDIGSPMTRQSEYVIDHFRGSASVAIGWLTISTSVRSVHSTVWLEPIGLGVNF